MIYRIQFKEVVYPKNYTPGDGYKIKKLGVAFLTDYTRAKFQDIESAIWSRAAKLRITGRVNGFEMFEYNNKMPMMAGTI